MARPSCDFRGAFVRAAPDADVGSANLCIARMVKMPQFSPGQTLLIDADDTLWENNVYFERAIAAFIGYLDHRSYSAAQVREALNAVERETILAHGYGLTSFTR